jgi:hypothetical protein
MAESDAVIDKGTAAVGSTMTQRSIHRHKDAVCIGAGASESGDAAHQATTC